MAGFADYDDDGDAIVQYLSVICALMDVVGITTHQRLGKLGLPGSLQYK